MNFVKDRSERFSRGNGSCGAPGLRPVFLSESERGFTLLEVMASLVILGIGILMVIQLFSGGLGLARAARDHSGAVLLAREKMAEAFVDWGLQPGVTEGEEGRLFKWKVEVSPYESTLSDNSTTLEIMKVVVSVKGMGRGRGAYKLTSLKSVWYEEEE